MGEERYARAIHNPQQHDFGVLVVFFVCSDRVGQQHFLSCSMDQTTAHAHAFDKE